MLKMFYPDAYVDSVFAIDYEALYRKGYRGLMFDIDNTLVHHGDDSTEEIDALFRRIHSLGFRTLMLSNNSRERIERFLKNIDAQYICEAGKPKPASYRKGAAMMGLELSQVLCIGDQVFTDILGANRSGMASILVQYIRQENETRIGKRRQLEGIILKFYRRSRNKQNRLGDITRKERIDCV